ncbi:dr1-associated corepressor isoform X1 [Zootoca vivipara]|uniref:dr1-associated corepressor isoform X1 n=1 Tax=Zootoca vivipara TaxID=8524 RepID=UPI00159170DD|nr:dr1-associated corepressor isoform X1 [Zootoca vivipara]XP_034953725.1 dr1-associated corepressor isoform X1 [Zootoca vivipara]
MPSKKKKYNARFPPARIKKIMQTDEEIGKVAAAVPVIISRALELFLESLLKKACHVTQSRNAKTMTTSHLKQCIELEQQFDFLKDLVASVPDMQGDAEDNLMEGEKVSRRGRKPGTGRKNGGPGKGRDPKQSGTDSEQEDETEDSESNGEEEVSHIAPPVRPAMHLPTVPAPYLHFTSPPIPAIPLPVAAPMGTVPVAPPPAPLASAQEDEEDYDS